MSHGRLFAVALVACAGAACRQDMHDQPKYKPLRGSAAFSDGRSARPLVAGTVARGTLREDDAFFRGKAAGAFVTEVPVKVTPELLARGHERFEIFCSPCHGRTGRGDGMIVQRGFKQPPSFHIERLRAMPIGYVYDVTTNGFGAMSDYADQVPPGDRWAIAAYVRVLQYSQHALASDLSAEQRRKLDEDAAPTPAREGAR